MNTDDPVIQFQDNTNNDHGLTSFSPPAISQVRQLILGDKCLKNVHTFELVGLNQLQEFRVGEYSCTQSTGLNGITIWYDSVFRIMDCPNLLSIHIGDYSFSGYKKMVLERLPLSGVSSWDCVSVFTEEFSLRSMSISMRIIV